MHIGNNNSDFKYLMELDANNNRDKKGSRCLLIERFEIGFSYQLYDQQRKQGFRNDKPYIQIPR